MKLKGDYIMYKFKNIIKGVGIAATMVVTLCSTLGVLTNSFDEIKQLKNASQGKNIC